MMHTHGVLAHATDIQRGCQSAQSIRKDLVDIINCWFGPKKTLVRVDELAKKKRWPAQTLLEWAGDSLPPQVLFEASNGSLATVKRRCVL